MSAILLVDLSGIWRQAWHAGGSREVNNANEVVMGKLAGYFNNYDHIGICTDYPPYERSKTYPEYKADRPPASDEMRDNLAALVSTIEQRGFRIFRAEGWEADDVIATLARAYKHEDITILSSDRDLIPITGLSMSITWHSPLTGEDLDAMEVVEKCGCSPHAFTMALSIAGGHDNIPGIRGIGLKTACAIAAMAPNPVNLLAILRSDPDSVPRSSLLVNEMTNIERWYDVVKLNYDLDINTDRLLDVVDPPKMEDMMDAENVAEVAVQAVESQAAKPKTVAIEVHGRSWSNALEPTGMEEAKLVSHWLYDSGLFQAFKSPQAILVAVMLGRDLGMPGAVTALNSIHVIQGRPTLKTETMVALVNRSGRADYLKMVELTEERCVVKTHKKGDPDPDPTVVTFTIEHAKKMGLLSRDQWQKQPETMLMWRAYAKIIRAVYPEITMGLYGMEEFE